MTDTPQPKKPTDAEFTILAAIWELDRATVRQVHEHLIQRSDIGYTTVLKLMQIMVEKGTLQRDTGVRPQVFWAAQPQGQTQKQLLGDLIDRAFRGTPGAVVLQALSMKRPPKEELDAIRRMLDELDSTSEEGGE